MTGAVFSYALLAALATALLVAALTDLRGRHIDNRLNAGITLAAPLWWWVMDFGPYDIGLQLALAAVTLCIAALLFAIGQMGGGDVKLLSALALWFSPGPFLQLVILMAVLGGGASVAMAALNMTQGRKERYRDAMATLAAIGWIGCTCAMLYALAFDRSIVPPGSVETLAAVLPSFWIIPVVVVLAIGVILVGVGHILRRQRSRIEVPYGVAIAAAALWVMGTFALPAVRFGALAV